MASLGLLALCVNDDMIDLVWFDMFFLGWGLGVGGR